jgi:chromosome segregation ATPase
MEKKSEEAMFPPSHSTKRWENSLAVKDKEVKMLTSSNDQLRRTITLLEAEMQELSNALLAKESTIHSRDRDIKKKNDEIRRLEALEQQDKGKERAIEMASTQNGQLLALLDAHEAKSKRLTEEKARLMDELKDANHVHVKHVKKASKLESQLRAELNHLHQEHVELKKLHESLVERHSGFEDMVKRTERDCRARVSVAEEEVAWRRDEQ